MSPSDPPSATASPSPPPGQQQPQGQYLNAAGLPHDAIEVEESEDNSDNYSTDGSYLSDSTSLNPSVFEYQYENGRRYHNYRAGQYFLPNDEQEQERLDMGHHLWTLILKGDLHRAPIERPKKIMDMGTGTGIWAIEMGDMYPDAEVIGTDLSPIQPNWVPPNVKFLVDDVESDWTYEHDSFDMVHGRNLVGSIKDWPGLLNKIYDYVAPGGYIEMHESDVCHIQSDDGTAAKAIHLGLTKTLLKEAGFKTGRHMDVAPKLAQLIRDAGFVDIQQETYKVPYNDWPRDKNFKEMGRWLSAVMETGMEAYGLALYTRVLGYSREEALEICENAKADLHNKKLHCYNYNFAVFGRKPHPHELQRGLSEEAASPLSDAPSPKEVV